MIGPDLAELLRKRVGFRNIVVHHYETIDPQIVEAILEKHLGDLRELNRIVVRHFGLA